MKEGGSKGEIVKLDEMLPEYYRLRGWDDKGTPTKDKLRRLGLDREASKLDDLLGNEMSGSPKSESQKLHDGDG